MLRDIAKPRHPTVETPRPWKPSWDRLIQSLVLIRVGQELGAETEAARAVASAIDLLVKAAAAVAASGWP